MYNLCHSVKIYVCFSVYISLRTWLKLEITKSKVIWYVNAICNFITEVTFSVCETFSERFSQCMERDSQ